jgi:hypothetical protein
MTDEHLSASQEPPTKVIARLNEQIAKWRKKADDRNRAQQVRQDPYDDYGHEMAVRASTLRDCADELEKLIREEPPTPPAQEKEQVTRMDSTSESRQHIDAGKD